MAQSYHLVLQEEARPVAIALFNHPSLIFHLGFDQSDLAKPDWYLDPSHPYLEAILHILTDLRNWSAVNYLEFLVSSGDDPMIGLQVKLDRRQLLPEESLFNLMKQLETQIIYKI